MKKLVVFAVIFLVLISLAAAKSIITSDAVKLQYDSDNNESVDLPETRNEDSDNSNRSKDNDDDSDKNETEVEEEEECEEWTCTKWSSCVNETKTRTCTRVNNCTEEDEMPRLTKRCEEKERLPNVRKIVDCPEECVCTGSVVKCILEDGTREMTITAGKSGNIIIQIKGVNASTSVTLYKANRTVYGTFRNNETREIKYLPDKVREKIKEKIKKQLEKEDMILNENGIYEYEGEKKAKLFFLFPVREKILAEIDSETGDIVQIRNPWWGFLAKDD